MVKPLDESHETVNHTCREVLALADEHRDQATVDLRTRRRTGHQTTAWMLRSMLA